VGGSENFLRLGQRDAIEALNGPPRRPLLRALTELSERGAVELVGLPELVQQPDDLVRMPDCVGRELRRDHELDPTPVGFAQVEQPPEKSLREHALSRVPLVRNGDEVRLVPACAELGNQIVGEDLGPAPLEWNLRRADGDPHLRPSRGTRTSNRVPPLPPTNSLRSQPSRVSAASAASVCLLMRS